MILEERIPRRSVRLFERAKAGLVSLSLLAMILICGCGLMKTDLSIGDGGSTDTDIDGDYCDAYDCWLTEPTNQTICYDELAQMTCTSFPCNSDGLPDFCGQDAQYPDNTHTFSCYDAEGAPQDPCDGSADADETVIDSLTGLEWQRTWEINLNWQEAIDYCEDLDYGGHDDWRLSGLHELAGIVDFGQHSPAINTTAHSREHRRIISGRRRTTMVIPMKHGSSV